MGDHHILVEKEKEVKAKMVKRTKLMATILVGLVTVLALALTVCADTDTADATLNVTNVAPVIVEVPAVSAVTLNSGTTKDVYIRFNVSDDNGADDINTTSAVALLTKGGETSRQNGVACDDSLAGSTWKFFNCTVTMQYYDGAGSWNINVSVSDNALNYAENTTETVTVNSLDSISLSIATIDFGAAAPGASDVDGTDLGVNNLGNTNYGTIQLTAYNLTDGGSNQIDASNFCANDIDDANSGCDALSHGSAQTITSALLNKGAGAQELVYSFVDLPAEVVSGSYSASSNWVVTASA